MRYSTLGSSGIKVSRVCLGSMTWGVQNTQQDADEQITYALDQGINFIDTAEMYAVPPGPETYGKTEKIIGNWLSRNTNKRKDIVLATKIAGPGAPWIRDGGPITKSTVISAVDDSLQRLQTDFIDLYQLHWPNYTSPHFGKHWPNSTRPSERNREQAIAGMHDILEGLKHCIDTGKILHCGLSDDTAWGISKYLELAQKYDLPTMTSIQNEFNLLHHKDWPYVIETCTMENVAYLPWSPLAGGMLSGKYLNGERPEGSRWSIPQRMGLFRDTELAGQAITAFKRLAEEHNMTASQLALLWCDNVDGVTSTIIGATSMAQLKEDIAAFDLSYTETLSKALHKLSQQHGMPF